MKIKTSITLSDSILKEIDRNLKYFGNRSKFIENAVSLYFVMKKREIRNQKDLEILNKNHDSLNKEASDILTYQVNF